MKQTLTCILYFCSALLLSGCGDSSTDSEELETEQLRVIYEVVSTGNGQAEITAKFTYMSGVIDGILPITETVSLEGQDRLTVETAGVTSGFTRGELYRRVIYTAQVDVGNDETDFILTLDRPSRSESFISTVTMAPAMEIIEPVESQAYYINDTINLRWTPVLQNRHSGISIKTTCDQDPDHHYLRSHKSTQETGEYLFVLPDYFDGLSLFTLTNQNSCTGELFFSRSETGTISPRFAYTSSITSRRESSKNITININ